jgi:hypothetical protein
MDEGWTRWIFDQNAIPYTRLTDADIRKGDLNQRFDVILIPDNSAGEITNGRRGFGEDSGGGAMAIRGSGNPGNRSDAPKVTEEGAATRPRAVAEGDGSREPQVPPEFRGGLGSGGVASLHAFLRAGGTIVTLNKASEVYAGNDSSQVQNALDGIDPRSFFIPGSILQVSVDTSNQIAFGSTPTVPIFYENGPAFKVSGDAKSIASFTTDKPLLSGWILGGQFLKGTSVIAEEPVGDGRIILFGFRPQYRAQSEVTYKFLFNALLYSSSKTVSLGESSAQLPASGAVAVGRKGGH